jgi:hypothetical protein
VTYREASPPEKRPECLERLCFGCSFLWDEACLDHVKPPGKDKAIVHARAQDKKRTELLP